MRKTEEEVEWENDESESESERESTNKVVDFRLDLIVPRLFAHFPVRAVCCACAALLISLFTLLKAI